VSSIIFVGKILNILKSSLLTCRKVVVVNCQVIGSSPFLIVK
jgi:hypothetical protein